MDNLIYVIPAMGIVGLLYTLIKVQLGIETGCGQRPYERDRPVHTGRCYGIFKS